MFRRLLTWGVLRNVLLAIATVGTLVALIYAVENWRGKRAWNQYRQEVVKKGVQLDFYAFIPQPVADKQNFAATPLLRPLSEFKTTQSGPVWLDTNGFQRATSISPPGRSIEPYRGHWRENEASDIDAIARALRPETLPTTNVEAPAETILRALEQYSDELAELQEASGRPKVRFNTNYETELPYAILLPHLSALRNIVGTLQLRALAAVELGDERQAYEDLELMIFVSNAMDADPFLVSKMVRIATLERAIQVFWEGLQEHLWTAEQLAELQGRFKSIDLISPLKYSLAVERAAASTVAEKVRRDPALLKELVFDADEKPLPYGLMPRGWFYFERINLDRAFDEFILPAMEGPGQQISPKTAAEVGRALDQWLAGSDVKQLLRHRILSVRLLPSLANVLVRTAAAETAVRQALIAAALERYWLEHGRYPERLSSLVPEFAKVIPGEAVVDQPFRYDRVQPDEYQLRSVGWDLRMEDGRGDFDVTVRTGRELTEGDWVWSQSSEGGNRED